MYEDRLDGRLDTTTYDQKAREIRAQQQQIRHKIAKIEAMMLAPAREAVDLMALTSRATCSRSKV
jgi:hypothetical protein